MPGDLPIKVRHSEVDLNSSNEVHDIELTWRSSSSSNSNSSSDDEGNSVQEVYTDYDKDLDEEWREHADQLRRKERKRRRKQKRLAEESEAEALHRKRRTVLVAVSFLPLLIASIALVAVVTTRSVDDNDKDDHAATAKLELFQEVSSSDVPTTVAPTALMTTNAPTPYPTPMPVAKGTAVGGGLRPITTSAPVSSSEDFTLILTDYYNSPDYPLIMDQESESTDSPTTGAPTGVPTESPSSPQPTICFPPGAICPPKKKDCCSGFCVRDDDTGEKVCSEGVAKMMVMDMEEGKGKQQNDIEMGDCVESGLYCPDKKEKRKCCSGKCSGGQEKVCL